MSGLKSGSGDDLWGDEDEPEDDAGNETPNETAAGEGDRGTGTAGGDEPAATARPAGGTPDGDDPDGSDGEAGSDPAGHATAPEESSMEGSRPGDGEPSRERPYIVRRAIRDKSVQFERDERLTFFVHRDVVDGERELVNELESTLGRDVPKFDVREAVYRAALRNRGDVLDELLRMGYAVDED